MKLQLKSDPYLRYFFFSLAILVLSLIVCLFTIHHIALKAIQINNNRYTSYKLAEELRQSSEDLTKMVRLYVGTGDKKYRDYYEEILAIRDGRAPRPKNYSQIYWDLVTDDARPSDYGDKSSIRSRMLRQDFTLEEYALLDEAEERSQKLTRIEIRAMNAMEGKFADRSGNYTIIGKPDPVLARKLVFSEDYMHQKVEIFSPIQAFFEMIEKRNKASTENINREMVWVVRLAIVLSILSTTVMLLSIIKVLRSLSKANSENDLLLLNIFPSSIVSRLKKGEEDIADEFAQASVMFADIVNFTQLTEQIGPKKIVSLLNQLFEDLDNMTELYRVEKVKTIGDSYMAVSGVPEITTLHAENLANYALAILSVLNEFNTKNQLNIQLRIGMSCGPLIAGVIGHKKFFYDVWGKIVNLASRLEASAEPNSILVSEKMAFMLEDKFNLKAHETLSIKGIGLVNAYYLLSKKIND